MRVLKVIYLSILFTLAMGLFCGEIPESMRLQDDTSNDFVADSSASAARENQAVLDSESASKKTKTAPIAAAQPASSNWFEISQISIEHPRVSGKELLSFLSLRRT